MTEEELYAKYLHFDEQIHELYNEQQKLIEISKVTKQEATFDIKHAKDFYKIMKKEYIFGIDVDCVLRDVLPVMVNLYNQEFGTSMQVKDVYEFKVEKPFHLINEKLGINASDWFFNQHALEIFKNSKVCYQAKEAIDILSKYGKIIIITYQKGILNKEYTLEWLEDNEIKYDGISFIKDKSIIKCDYFIDDNDWNFTNCNASVGVLINQPYNININLDELKEKTNCKIIQRQSSLFDFACKLETMSKQNISY